MTLRLRMPDGRLVTVAPHALERYIERVRPAMTPRQAAKDLRRLVAATGRVLDRPPAWAVRQRHGDITGWVALGEDIVFPVIGGCCIPTCLTRGGLSPAAVERRRVKQARRQERAHRRGMRDPRDGGRYQRPPARWREAA